MLAIGLRQSEHNHEESMVVLETANGPVIIRCLSATKDWVRVGITAPNDVIIRRLSVLPESQKAEYINRR